MARTAAVAGTATAVSNRVSRRQANRWAAQDAPAYDPYAQQQYAEPPPPPPPPPAYSEPPPAAADPIAQLKDLAALHQAGALTDDEFAVQKAKLLG
jgi:hypothetical protein